MNIIDLPPDILLIIAEYTIPDGYDDFLMTCKRVHSIGLDRFPMHSKLRREFRHFKYVSDVLLPSQESMTSVTRSRHLPSTPEGPIRTYELPAQLLVAIEREPIIARYIVHADFSDDSRRYLVGSHPQEMSRERYQEGDAAKQSLRSLLHKSPFLKENNIDPETWLRNISFHTERPGWLAAVFLLTLLPNVRTLKLPIYWPGFSRDGKRSKEVDAVLSSIVKRANGGFDGASMAPLSNLRALLPSRFITHHQNNTSLAAVNPFLALNSVKFFFGNGVAYHPDDRKSGLKQWDLFSHSLREVVLTDCSMSPKMLMDFTSRIPNLRSVVYSGRRGIKYWEEASGIVEALLASCSQQLEKLHVSCRNMHRSNPINLSGFTPLKDVALDINMLAHRLDWNTPALEGDYDQKRYTLVHGFLIPRLVDVLPVSTEKLTLSHRADGMDINTVELKGSLEALLQDFLYSLEDKMPNLKELFLACEESDILQAARMGNRWIVKLADMSFYADNESGPYCWFRSGPPGSVQEITIRTLGYLSVHYRQDSLSCGSLPQSKKCTYRKSRGEENPFWDDAPCETSSHRPGDAEIIQDIYRHVWGSP